MSRDARHIISNRQSEIILVCFLVLCIILHSQSQQYHFDLPIFVFKPLENNFLFERSGKTGFRSCSKKENPGRF